ncbi:hypothetical protein BH11ACT1_BH11ACT1_18060 [soil metagenome]
MSNLDMLEDMGVRIVEVDGLSKAAAYVPGLDVLLIRPDVSEATLARAPTSCYSATVRTERVPLGRVSV